MWPVEYENYPCDEPLIGEQVEPGKEIIGCEMHEVNGYGLTDHRYRRKPNFFYRLFHALKYRLL